MLTNPEYRKFLLPNLPYKQEELNKHLINVNFNDLFISHLPSRFEAPVTNEHHSINLERFYTSKLSRNNKRVYSVDLTSRNSVKENIPERDPQK